MDNKYDVHGNEVLVVGELTDGRIVVMTKSTDLEYQNSGRASYLSIVDKVFRIPPLDIKEDIIKAYLFLREHNHTISSEVLEFIKEASLKEMQRQNRTRYE